MTIQTPNTPKTEVASEVKALSVISTGIAQMHYEHLQGSKLPSLMWVFFGRKWFPDRPISVFVIEHEKGIVLFDAGMNIRAKTDPNYWENRITRLIMNKIFRFEIGSEDTLTNRLKEAGYDAGDVSRAVISHLHFDHVGCIEEVPQADLFVASDAWEHMLGPHPDREAVLRRDIDVPGAKWNQFEFEPTDDETLAPFTMANDLMGDGSMMLLPTPGHMPGSTSMLVRTDPPLLFVGDLCYSLKGLMEDIFPGTGEKEVLADTYAKVRKLKEKTPGLLILPAHDPDAVAAVKAHPLFKQPAS